MKNETDQSPAPLRQLVGEIFDLIKKYHQFRFKSELLFYFKDQSYDSVNESLNMLIMDGKIHRFHDKIFLSKKARDDYGYKFHRIVECILPNAPDDRASAAGSASIILLDSEGGT